MRFFATTTVSSVVISSLIMMSLSVAQAQVRSSSNFSLQSDSINVGGGLSSSTNFVQESTVGEIATGRSTSATFSLQAGYQQMQEVYLSLAGGVDIVMDPALPGLTGGESNGSTTFTVITDSPSGYELLIRSERDPAMQKADGSSVIDNYPGPTVNLDFNFNYSPTEAVFGYTAEGEDIRSVFMDDGVTCNTGVDDTPDACWRLIRDLNDRFAISQNANHPSGATTTLKFRVGIGSGANVESGEYYATTTVTALPL